MAIKCIVNKIERTFTITDESKENLISFEKVNAHYYPSKINVDSNFPPTLESFKNLNHSFTYILKIVKDGVSKINIPCEKTRSIFELLKELEYAKKLINSSKRSVDKIVPRDSSSLKIDDFSIIIGNYKPTPFIDLKFGRNSSGDFVGLIKYITKEDIDSIIKNLSVFLSFIIYRYSETKIQMNKSIQRLVKVSPDEKVILLPINYNALLVDEKMFFKNRKLYRYIPIKSHCIISFFERKDRAFVSRVRIKSLSKDMIKATPIAIDFSSLDEDFEVPLKNLINIKDSIKVLEYTTLNDAISDFYARFLENSSFLKDEFSTKPSEYLFKEYGYTIYKELEETLRFIIFNRYTSQVKEMESLVNMIKETIVPELKLLSKQKGAL